MVGILLLTHENIGEALLKSTHLILGKLPLPAQALSVAFVINFEEVLNQTKTLCETLDDGDGVLILTDLYAATPDNIAVLCQNDPKIKVVSGVNLPMLIKIMNYHQLKLPELMIKAQAGAINGIREHKNDKPQS